MGALRRWLTARAGSSSGPGRSQPRRSTASPSCPGSRTRPTRRSRPSMRSRSRCGAGPPTGTCASPARTGSAPSESSTSSWLRSRRVSSLAATPATRSSPTSSAAALGLPARAESDQEERYLLHVCLSRPTRRLHLCWRESDDDGGAAAPSPFLDDLAEVIEGSPLGGGDDAEIQAKRRPLGEVTFPVGDAPSLDELLAIAGRPPNGRDPRRPRARRRRLRGDPQPPRPGRGSSGGRQARPARRARGRRGAREAPPLRRLDAGGVRGLLVPLVRRARARSRAARRRARDPDPGLGDPRSPRGPLPRAAPRRPRPPPRDPRRVASAGGRAGRPAGRRPGPRRRRRPGDRIAGSNARARRHLPRARGGDRDPAHSRPRAPGGRVRRPRGRRARSAGAGRVQPARQDRPRRPVALRRRRPDPRLQGLAPGDERART